MKSSPSPQFSLEQSIARENAKHATGIQIEVLSADFQEPLAIAIHGWPGTGKTRFGMTAPSPIGAVPLGRKARQTMVETMKLLDKTVIIPSADLIRTGNPMEVVALPDECTNKNKSMRLEDVQPTCCSRHYYRWHVNRTKALIFRYAAMPVEQCRSIVIDDASLLYDDILFATYGRNDRIMPLDRKTANNEMKEIWNICSVKHVVMIHRSSEVYVNDKGTGRARLNGWKHTGFEANVILRMESNADDLKKNPTAELEFSAVVEQCQANAGIIGTKIEPAELVCFPYLGTLVYPDTEMEDWE